MRLIPVRLKTFSSKCTQKCHRKGFLIEVNCCNFHGIGMRKEFCPFWGGWIEVKGSYKVWKLRLNDIKGLLVSLNSEFKDVIMQTLRTILDSHFSKKYGSLGHILEVNFQVFSTYIITISPSMHCWYQSPNISRAKWKYLVLLV